MEVTHVEPDRIERVILISWPIFTFKLLTKKSPPAEASEPSVKTDSWCRF